MVRKVETFPPASPMTCRCGHYAAGWSAPYAAIKGNTNCTDWKERPGTGCVRYDKIGDAVTVIDVASGQTRAKVVKTAPGNAEKLTP